VCTNSCCPNLCAPTAAVQIYVHQQLLSISVCTNSCCPNLCAPTTVVHICVHKQLLLLSSLNVFSIHGRGQGSTLTNPDRSLRIIFWPSLLHLPDEGAEDAVDIYGEYPGDGIWRGHDSPLGPHHVHATLEMPRCLSFFLYKETG
jgi:hypothetical protein